MTSNLPKPPVSRSKTVILASIVLFALSAWIFMLCAFIGCSGIAKITLIPAGMCVLTIVCLVFSLHVNVPPSRDDDAKND